MKKLFCVLGFIVILTGVLCWSGCSLLCQHQYEMTPSKVATCFEPGRMLYTCSKCGNSFEQEIERLEHSFGNATCTNPKMCIHCDSVDGVALGHVWRDATCSKARDCSRCGITEGEKAEHVFTRKITTDFYLCSEATVESPAKYYYACETCSQKSKNTYLHGTCKQAEWVQEYYVDAKFGEATDMWYICPRDDIKGTFSNSATSNSPLLVDFLYDCEGDITIFLYEYADRDNLVKNNSSRYLDYYIIAIKNERGKTIEVWGNIPPGLDRIYISDGYLADVLAMMKNSETMRFFIQNDDYPTTVYRFDLYLTDFLYLYNKVRSS